MKLELNQAALELIVDALHYKASMEAGQTQAPDLCGREDYAEWDLAQALSNWRDTENYPDQNWYVRRIGDTT